PPREAPPVGRDGEGARSAALDRGAPVRLPRARLPRRSLRRRLRRRRAPGDGGRLRLPPVPPAQGDHHRRGRRRRGRRRAAAREAIRAALADQGIETQIASYALHTLALYRDDPAKFPVAVRLHHQALALPLFNGLPERDIDRVSDALLSALRP